MKIKYLNRTALSKVKNIVTYRSGIPVSASIVIHFLGLIQKHI